MPKVKKVKKDGTPSKQGEGGGNHAGTQGRKASIDLLADKKVKRLIDEKFVVLAQKHAIPYLESVITGKETVEPKDRIKVAIEILDRALGKPVPVAKDTQNNTVPVMFYIPERE